MNMITQFNKYLEKSFNNYLKTYFCDTNYCYKSSNFNNYISFMNDLDNFSDSFLKDIIKSYFEYIDNVFFNSSYRKQFCISNGFYERKNFVTMFGEINFKRRYYYDKITKEWFFFTDLFFSLPKRKHFDPFVSAEIIKTVTENSYSKSGQIVASKIGKRLKDTINISRATVRNIVMSFEPEDIQEKNEKRVERLFIMLDEKFVSSQFNEGSDHMIKAAVIFEGTELEYKNKKKYDSKNRYKLISSHTCASVDNSLTMDVVDYIYKAYDTDFLKEIFFMGDRGRWIVTFSKSQWLKFNPDLQIYSTSDGYHPVQAINQLTTKKHLDFRDALLDLILNDDKELFKDEVLKFMGEHKERTTTIINKMEYILNNWEAIQIYINNEFLSCSIESHISHYFADLFTSRPKAYSKQGLMKLLKLRLLKINGINLKNLYLSSIGFTKNKKDTITISQPKHQINYTPKTNKYDYEYKAILPQAYKQIKQLKMI